MGRLLITSLALTLAAAVGATASYGGDVDAGRTRAAACAGCHGADGNSPVPTWPKLAGQQQDYIIKQLEDFQQGARTDPMMTGLAKGLSPDDRANLAAWFASREVVPAPASGDVALGARLYHRGQLRDGVPPCDVCHGVDGAGSPGFGNGGFPAIGGQHAAYTAKQLRDFASGRRGNDHGKMMGHIASKLGENEILALSAYLQTMNSALGTPP